MVLMTQSGKDTLKIGAQAPSFKLPATDGKTYGLDDFKDKNVLVIAFTCNHCPYAEANEGRFNDLVKEFSGKSAAFLAINPNDAQNYPDDSFDNMKIRARERKFAYPYLRDEDQSIAHAYGAVCTPHYFVLDAQRKLAYEGRLDDNWKDAKAVKERDLRDAVTALLNDRPIAKPSTNPMGCSIKWL